MVGPLLVCPSWWGGGGSGAAVAAASGAMVLVVPVGAVAVGVAVSSVAVVAVAGAGGAGAWVWEIEAVASPVPELLPATLNWMGPVLLYRKVAAEGKPGSAVKVEAGPGLLPGGLGPLPAVWPRPLL